MRRLAGACQTVRISLTLICLAGVIGLVIVVALWRVRTADGPDSQTGKRPEGYWQSLGISLGLVLGMAIGLPLGIAMDNIAIGMALGPGFGLSIGVAIGAALEQKHKHELRPLTESERRAPSRATLIGIGALVLGLAALIVVLLVILQQVSRHPSRWRSSK
jgi:hypothetical protein